MTKRPEKPPFNRKPADFRFPEFSVFEINGNSVYIHPSNYNELVNCRISLKSGMVNDTKPGMAYLTTTMLTRGSSRYPADTIAETIDYLGGTVNCSANYDESTLSITTLNENFDKAFDIAADALQTPLFDSTEFGRLVRKHIADIKQEMVELSYLSQLKFYETIFKGHQYAHPLIGTEESVLTVTRDEIAEWYEKNIQGQPLTFIFTGKITIERALGLVEKYFGKTTHHHRLRSAKVPKGIDKNIFNSIDKSDAHQISLRMGKFVIDRNNPDYLPLQITNTVFGGYFMSRLNKILREKKGLTYGIFSFLEFRRLATLQSVSTSINKENLGLAINFILAEYEKIQSRKISNNELYPVKQYLLGAYLRGVETPQQVAAMLNTLLVNNLPLDYYDKYYRNIIKIKPDDLMEAQQKYFKSDNLVIVAAGEIETITSQFAKVNKL